MITNISVVVLAKNSEKTILKVLESLKEFNDVVVYDNGSTDNTMSITKTFSNVNLIQGEFKGFGWTKNKAASFAKNDWILNIDSDEVVDSELLETLKNKSLNSNTVYKLHSVGFYKDIRVRYCGWTLSVNRLYNIKKTHFNSNLVHEKIIANGFIIEKLKGNIEHYTYHSISHFMVKADLYSTLFARDNVGKRSSSPLKAFFNGMYSFIRTYFLRRGFLDGYVGLIIAYSHMVTNFYKYIKLYEANIELEKTKEIL